MSIFLLFCGCCCVIVSQAYMSDVVNALQFIVLRCLLLTVTMLHYLMFKVLIINTA